MLNQKMQGSNSTIGELMNTQEKSIKDYYNSNDNPIELKE